MLAPTAVSVDLDADLGEVSPAEVKLMLDYVSRCGLDRTRSWAGAHVLVKLLPVSCRTSVTIPLQIGEEVIGRIAVDWVKREKSNRKGALAGLDSASNVSRKFHS